MSCVRPLDGYRATMGRVIIVERGARPPRDSTGRIPMSIPCGKCIGCRMNRAREWGIRCLHEAKLWPENCYVTLTYNDEFLPPGGSLVVRDVQLFMKRLRKSMPDRKIRFFLGGEYGEYNKRPHYHALLFNCGFGDCVRWGDNKRGEPLYVSDTLSSMWGYGFCTIGAITFDSAVYCAKYALKKVNGDLAFEHYTVYDENGECFERVPEFAVMSRRPGIGAGYADKYREEILSHDSVVINGRAVKPPRYYASRFEGDKRVEINQRRRKRVAVLNRKDNTDERLGVKEKLMQIAAEKKERSL